MGKQHPPVATRPKPLEIRSGVTIAYPFLYQALLPLLSKDRAKRLFHLAAMGLELERGNLAPAPTGWGAAAERRPAPADAPGSWGNGGDAQRLSTPDLMQMGGGTPAK